MGHAEGVHHSRSTGDVHDFEYDYCRRFGPDHLRDRYRRFTLADCRAASLEPISVPAFFFNRESATVVIEACGTVHFWDRWLKDLGFVARLIPTHYVRPALIDDESVPQALHAALLEIVSEIRSLEQRMKTIERQLQQYADTSRDVQSIQQVPGIGLLTATVLVAAAAHRTTFATAAIWRPGWD